MIIHGSRTLTLYWDPSKGKRKIQDSSSSQFMSLHNCTGDQPSTDPFLAVPVVSTYWEHLNSSNPELWQAPEMLVWIGGKRTYSQLLSKGMGLVGFIHPVLLLLLLFVFSFFFLSGSKGDMLNAPIDKDLRHQGRWAAKIGSH